MFIRQADGRRASYVVIGAFILLEMMLRGLAGVFTVLRRWLEDRRQAQVSGCECEYVCFVCVCVF